MEPLHSTPPSLDFDLWAWQHSSPKHSTVAMREYRDDHRNSCPTTWRKIASAIVNNPYISSVQLDVGTVTDHASIQAMVDALQSLRNLKTLHVQTLLGHHEAHSLLALHLIAAVARRSTTLGEVKLEGLWINNTTSAQVFSNLLQHDGIRAWTWSHVQCATPELEAMVCQAWSKNTSWSSWKLVGQVPLNWIQAAASACASSSTTTGLRSLELESVTARHYVLWRSVQSLLCSSNCNWRLHVSAMNLNGTTWRALASCSQLGHLSLTRCCIDARFPVVSLPWLVSSIELIWNRLEDESKLVELLSRLYQGPGGPRDYCRRHSMVLHHHWCQIFEWDLPVPADVATIVGTRVQWKGTRWPGSVVRRLDFYELLGDCRRSKSSWPEKVPQNSLGTSVLFHFLREDPVFCFKDSAL
eukprot:scaffold7349_cov173-Amphora_coffeaeformis.AAC.117